jgi:hypothetical protein
LAGENLPKVGETVVIFIHDTNIQAENELSSRFLVFFIKK